MNLTLDLTFSVNGEFNAGTFYVKINNDRLRISNPKSFSDVRCRPKYVPV